ncbi:MAG: Spy/CpxP family protein refolding chaperone [Gemmatimonadaceae bacterium]|nr:Spy/CpxP family protein refolding chaperone [Gemmatimonadaceae bacterium]
MARLRTVALGAALVAATAGAGIAQTTQGTRPDTAKAGDWRKGQAGKGRGEMGPERRRKMERGMRGHAGMGHHGHGRGVRPGAQGRPGMQGMDFMRGLNLTETQRTQVRAIHEKFQPQLKTIRERARTEFEATREARQRGDTAAVKASLQRSRQNIESQTATLHEQMFRETRAVLTAEQRAKIDAQLAERIKRLDEDKARLERLRR